MKKDAHETRSTVVSPFALKRLEDDGSFEGYGSVFGLRDSFGDVVAKGAFERTLKEDHRPALLWQHNTDQPIGIYTEIREDDIGLFVKGKFTEGVTLADEALLLLKAGALDGLSIGFQTKRSDLDEETGDRTILEVKLFEVSLVTFPANEAARVTDVKARPTEREMETILRDAGFSRADAKRIVAATHPIHATQRDAEAVLQGLQDSLNGLLAKVTKP